MTSAAQRLGLMMLGAALIVTLAVSVSLRPLHRLGDAIAQRSPDDLSPLDTQVPAEVAGLLEPINSFMSRLHNALQGLRNFTGNAAHQLRTPLTVVRMQLALVARARSLEEAKEAAGKGDQALARAERVLAQLLALARVDAAAGHPLQAVDLSSLAREIAADQVPAAAAMGADLGFEGEEGLWVKADPLLLAEAVNNLISNAISYGGTGVEITLRVRREAGQALLQIEDDGPGLPVEKRGQISRFSRGSTLGVKSSTLGAKGSAIGAKGSGPEGMGLGLAVVEEIIRLFGGSFRLDEARGGKGLLASIRLDLTDPPDPA